MNRRGIMPYWICAAQPHEDGTPHWHIVAWLRDTDEAAAVEAILRQKFEGEALHAIDVKRLSGGARAAAKYAIRAMSYGARHVAPKGEENTAAREAEWARIVGRRRYRTSHSRATLWRLLRRPDLRLSGPGEAVQAGVDDDNFAAFNTAADETGIRIAYAPTVTRYGEDAKRVIGVQIGEVIHVPTREWQMRRKPTHTAVRTVMPIDQGCTHAREESAACQRRDRIEAGEVAGGAPPPLPAGGNNQIETTEQAARRAAFVRELEQEVAAWG